MEKNIYYYFTIQRITGARITGFITISIPICCVTPRNSIIANSCTPIVFYTLVCKWKSTWFFCGCQAPYSGLYSRVWTLSTLNFVTSRLFEHTLRYIGLLFPLNGITELVNPPSCFSLFQM